MGRSSWWVCVVLLGCGKVEPLVDASVAHDAPKSIDTAPACQAPNMACGTSCIDPMTDNMHCGSCMTACSTPAQACFTGHCGYATSSCAVIHAFDPNAPSGAYTNMTDNSQIFCDMADGLNGGPPPTQYDELALGQFDIATAGFTIIDSPMLQNPVIQQAFIFLFNLQNGGAIALQSWTAGNVCITAATAPNSPRLLLSGSILFPAVAGSTTGNAASFTQGAVYTPAIVGITPPVYPATPLAADFFNVHPASQGVNCGDGSNPALFFKRH